MTISEQGPGFFALPGNVRTCQFFGDAIGDGSAQIKALDIATGAT
ncbi:hypothetical protein [Cupriavidus basilensis]|nr:hypothetical protein [Cupriavidus basilensis]